jgi:hypothetical protein
MQPRATDSRPTCDSCIAKAARAILAFAGRKHGGSGTTEAKSAGTLKKFWSEPSDCGKNVLTEVHRMS